MTGRLPGCAMKEHIERFPNSPFVLHAPYGASGDQPEAIRELSEGVQDGLMGQTLLGVTGSGKTFTMASIVARCGGRTLLAPLILAFSSFGSLAVFFFA